MLLLTRGEGVALLCAAAAALFVSPLLLTSAPVDWQFLSTYDDTDNFATNPILQGDFLFSWENLFAMAMMCRINVYEPLGWLLKASIVQCFGLNSWVIRVATLVLHFAAGVVLMRVSALLIEINNLLSRISTQPNNKDSADMQPDVAAPSSTYFLSSCLSTLLFLVHPIHIEVIAWPSAQPYALAALFANASLLFYLRKTHLALQSSRSLDQGDQKHDWLVAGFYLCSVLSKSVTVLLPAAFFFIDALVFVKLHLLVNIKTTIPQELLTYVSRKAPVLLVTLSFVGVTIWSNGEDWDDLLTLSLPQRILRAAAMPVWTLGHILWPAKLRMHYQLREDDLELVGNPELLVSIFTLLMCVVMGLWRCKERLAPQLLLATLYYLVMMLPISGLVQHGIVLRGCDRYAYFPSAVFVPFGGYVLGNHLFGGDGNIREPSTE